MKKLELAEAFAKCHPSDFTLQYPPRREYFQERFQADVAGELLSELQAQKSLLTYLHIPYCEHKCSYCNFAVSTRNSPSEHERYLETLLQAVATFFESSAVKSVPGLDIGGGTPTLLEKELLGKLFSELRKLVPAERSAYSIETTPAIAALEPSKMELLAEHCARVSMGLQTSEREHLQSLRRGGEASHPERALEVLLSSGFERVNVDLIFGLPGQTLESFLSDVRHAAASGVDSITTYDCLYRGKGRAFTKRLLGVPTAEEYGRFYDAAHELLLSEGFFALYGSVNYSRHPGETGTSPYFEGRLLEGRSFVGFGNYATSFHQDLWAFAPAAVKEWQEASKSTCLPVGFGYRLPQEELLAKHALLSWSFGKLKRSSFREAHGVSLEEVLPRELASLLVRGVIESTPEGYSLRSGHFASMPLLRSFFYSEEALAWLASLPGGL